MPNKTNDHATGTVHVMANALYVLTLSRSTATWLKEHDPAAYRQATLALEQYERDYCQKPVSHTQ
jgi:hypothetical protein